MKPASTSPSVTHSLAIVYVSSIVIAVLMTVASILGLVYTSSMYPTKELQQSFLTTDIINLSIGLPMLLGSMWFARRRNILGLLFWPGALFYVLYHYIVYTIGLPLNMGFLFALLVLVLSIYTIAGLVAAIDAKAVQRQLVNGLSERLYGGVLAGLGVAFALLALGTLGNAIATGTRLPEPEIGLQVSDTMLATAWIIGGILWWRREPIGYVVGPGLLFQGAMLFAGLLVLILLQPFLTATPFSVVDFVVILGMSLILFVPLGLFVRSVLLTKGV